ncbi:TIGR03943 family protein [Actinoplanes regularis]|uniref:TIGR03943 family protein n=2 Tax=Actinoplanes regularis TaxID=52697 RepID=A0A239G220_9ACTN|nr:TIGR03943 family protein [Actinoplanes regularis]GIE90043.1 membrane protein [Actinoplanes regularis]SNS62748.1 TIGR03943 family protein [Actinoplanes regularis]
MSRMAQAVIMLLFGGAVIKATVTDVFLRYVKEGLRPFLLLAGILLVAAALMTIWYDLRAARRGTPEPGGDHGHGHDDGHGHGHHEPRVGWLLLLPVLGLLLISPPALGSFAAGQTGSVGLSAASDYPPLPEGDPVEVTLLDYASRAIFDGGRSLTGRDVKLTGFITPGPDGKPMLARIVLACCAADGRPIKIGLTGVPIDTPPDSWVEVVGVYSNQVGTDPVNQAQVAYFEIRSWQEIDQPKQPYD